MNAESTPAEARVVVMDDHEVVGTGHAAFPLAVGECVG
jgi:hypothetical protein